MKNLKIAINIYYEPTTPLKNLLAYNPEVYMSIKTNLGVAYKCQFSDNMLCNIHEKNKTYNELTVLYWLWKNYDKLKLPKYIGYNHYRRLFMLNDILDYNQYDIIIGQPRKYKNTPIHNQSPRQQYIRNHVEKDLKIAENIIHAKNQKMYTEFENFLDNGPKDCLFAPCNMFVMKKEIFFEYCQSVFPILFEIESKIDLTNRSQYQSRAIAFISERLFSCYAFNKAKTLKTKSIPIMMLKENGKLIDQNK